MSKIRTISSEVDLEKELKRKFRYSLNVDQKAFYFDEGAKNFYNMKPSNKVKNDGFNLDENYQFLKKNFLKKDQEITFISLGSGNSNREKKLLNKAHKEGYKLSYFGVESSMTMIELAQKNMENEKYPVNFIYADFADEKFKEDFYQIVNPKSKKIFAFFGATLGNVPQNYIANTLRNMLKPKDILWIDVKVLEELTDSAANHYFKFYLEYIKNPADVNFINYPLKRFNIPEENGKLILEMIRENSINTLLFKFSFLVEKELEFKINGEPFTLLKNDKVELLNIRVYELNSLKYFFEKRGFKVIDYFLFKDRVQLAFEKL